MARRSARSAAANRSESARGVLGRAAAGEAACPLACDGDAEGPPPPHATRAATPAARARTVRIASTRTGMPKHHRAAGDVVGWSTGPLDNCSAISRYALILVIA